MARYYDILCDDSSLGEQTWEKGAKAGCKKDAVNKALEKSCLSTTDIDFFVCGGFTQSMY